MNYDPKLSLHSFKLTYLMDFSCNYHYELVLYCVFSFSLSFRTSLSHRTITRRCSVERKKR